MKEGFETPDGKRVDVEKAFKNPDHPFRIVIVCAMWMTGFDVPSLSTLYLDKLLKAHTLMQAIARANRVHEGKNNGLIIDYCGILKNLRKALATFAGHQGGSLINSDTPQPEVDPVKPEEELLAVLVEAIALVRSYLEERGFRLDNIIEAYNREKDRMTIEKTFEELLRFTDALDKESRRALREGLDEETLALFDLLLKPALSKQDIERLKQVASELLAKLKAEKLRADNWWEKQATQDAVKVEIRDFLWSEETGLPVECYSDQEVDAKAEQVYLHIFNVYTSSSFFMECNPLSGGLSSALTEPLRVETRDLAGNHPHFARSRQPNAGDGK